MGITDKQAPIKGLTCDTSRKACENKIITQLLTKYF